jgi:hypothetical protein
MRNSPSKGSALMAYTRFSPDKGADMNILYTKAAHRHHPLKQPA